MIQDIYNHEDRGPGFTHHMGDGCDPFEKSTGNSPKIALDALVRDLTKIPPMSKSEIRARIVALTEGTQGSGISADHKGGVMTDDIPDDWLDELCDTYPQTLRKFKDNSPTAYAGFKAAILSAVKEVLEREMPNCDEGCKHETHEGQHVIWWMGFNECRSEVQEVIERVLKV
jgi:hypothetical protein